MNVDSAGARGNIACLIHDLALRSTVVRTLEHDGFVPVILSSAASADGSASLPAAALVDRVKDIATLRARLERPVVVIGHTNSPAAAENAILWGADDYLPVPLSTIRLAARIERPSPASVLTFEDLVFYERERMVRRGDRTAKLTENESRLLGFLMSHPYVCHRTDDLRTSIWRGRDIKPGTVCTFVCLLRRKLNAGGEADLIETIHGLGYRFHHVDASSRAM